ncbi:16138_t:CDS:1, partial [Dentiscutata heterogama]
PNISSIVMSYTSIILVSNNLIYNPVPTEEFNTIVVVAFTEKTSSTNNNTLLLNNPIPIDTNEYSN